MDSNGYIKLYRCLLEHPIWKTSTAEQKVILITLLEMANHAPAKWVWKGKEFEVDRGQMITSIPEIKRAAGVGISDKNVRTALKRFEQVFGFLTDESTRTGRLITIVNYSKWQGADFGTKTGEKVADRLADIETPSDPVNNSIGEHSSFETGRQTGRQVADGWQLTRTIRRIRRIRIIYINPL